MRLLQKSEVNKALAVEKKTEIDEGLKLAKRIDNLREVAAAEETSLAKFRSETVAKIHEETTAAAKKRDEARAEADKAEDRLREARAPLDIEWKEVKKQQEYLIVRQNILKKREFLLDEGQLQLVEDRKVIKAVVERVNRQDDESKQNLNDSRRDSQAASVALQSAQAIQGKAEALKKMTGDSLTHREEVVKEREASAILKETDISAREKAFADRWRLLLDREALLERTIKRTKQ